MARDNRKKGKDAHAAGGHAHRLDGRAPKLDAKLAKVVAKRVKKLRGQLADATRREHKKVRALDKAHRRRQLIQSALDELSMEASPTTPRPMEPAAAVAPAPAPQVPDAANAPAPARGRRGKATPKG